MIGITLLLLAQTSGDTLRWYDTTSVGYECVGYTGGGILYWAIVLPIDSSLDGRTVHSGRLHICQEMNYPGVLNLSLGDHNSPNVLLDSSSFHATEYGFCDIFFGDTITLHQGDTVWLWCAQYQEFGEYPATTDADQRFGHVEI